MYLINIAIFFFHIPIAIVLKLFHLLFRVSDQIASLKFKTRP